MITKNHNRVYRMEKRWNPVEVKILKYKFLVNCAHHDLFLMPQYYADRTDRSRPLTVFVVALFLIATSLLSNLCVAEEQKR